MTGTSTDYRRPESVLVVVFTDGGDVALLKRSKPFDFWQSVTGSLQAGETHAAAAQRELREETGLGNEGVLMFTGVSRQFTIDPRWRNRFAPGVTENVEYEYQYRVQNRTTITLSEDEHSALQWLPVEDAVRRVWSWTNRQAIEQLNVT
ncbi:MAG: dihydroneopterin triphosphate diphosphatase, partial [candidate division NC10 bacterium]